MPKIKNVEVQSSQNVNIANVYSNSLLISVVIPNINRFESLIKAVESVLSQNLNSIEIVIIDDSAPLLFEKIVEKYKHDNKIKVIRGDRRGDAAARNKGVNLSAGQLIAFCDSDDIWLPGKLEAHLELWNKYPYLGFTWDKWNQIGMGKDKIRGDSLSKSSETYQIVSGDNIFTRLWLIGNDIHMSSGIASREGLNSIGGFPQTSPCDWHLWLLLSTKFNGGFVNKVYTHKLITPSSLGVNKKVMLREFFETTLFRFRIFKYLRLEGNVSYSELLKGYLTLSLYWLYILIFK